MHRRAATISVLYLSIAARFLWSLDANPILFFYDIYVTKCVAKTTHRAHHDNTIEDGGGGGGRRIFPPGSAPSLEGKTIWITGASSGIGAELALQLSSAMGARGHLVLSGRRREKLESVARSCRDAAAAAAASNSKLPQFSFGGDVDNANDADDHDDDGEMKVSIVPFDMAGGGGTTDDVLDSAVDAALRLASPSGIDVLILNAGQYQCSPALDTDVDEALSHLMRVNFLSPVRLSHKLMRKDRWKERGRGHLVAVSSLMGRGASALNALYSSTKHASRGYFHSLAAEERSWLRVDVVLPGATDTNLWEGSSTRGIVAEDYDRAGGGESKQQCDDDRRRRRPPHADDRSKMSVRRCARLIVSGMIGPNSFFFETWITRNPGLLWVYLAAHEPTTFRLATNLIAPLRMEMWKENGEDALYLPTLLLRMWENGVDYFRRWSGRLLSSPP